MQRTAMALVLASLFAGFVACARTIEVPKYESLFQPTSTIQEIMLSVVDPNVDAIWNSVATTETKSGIEERQPQSDEEWKTLRQQAITLSEVANLLVIEGRSVAKEGASTSTHPVELSPQDIQKGIKANWPEFVQKAHQLHDAAHQAIVAIDSKNPQELVRAGSLIEHACEQCHSKFWYPNDKRPLAQQEIGLHTSSNSLYLKLRSAS